MAFKFSTRQPPESQSCRTVAEQLTQSNPYLRTRPLGGRRRHGQRTERTVRKTKGNFSYILDARWGAPSTENTILLSSVGSLFACLASYPISHPIPSSSPPPALLALPRRSSSNDRSSPPRPLPTLHVLPNPPRCLNPEIVCNYSSAAPRCCGISRFLHFVP